MRNVLTIARRELGSYFGSPLAYVVTAAFLIICGFFFYLNILYSRSATIEPVVQTVLTILLLISPVLSMRLLAEEQRTGTLELLLTAPVRDYEVVLGKYVAGLAFVGVMLLATLLYPALLFALGSPDKGAVLGGFLAMLLFAAAATAIGLFASSLSQNQIVSAVVAFAIMIVLWVFDGLSGTFSGKAGEVISYLGLYSHSSDLTKGVIDTRDVVYYLSLVAIPLFLTTRTLEARRWRG
jgi:ABC-2 type transport system permease protein